MNGYTGFHPSRTCLLRYRGPQPPSGWLVRWERRVSRLLLGWVGLLGTVLLTSQLALPGMHRLAYGLLIVLAATSPVAGLLLLGLVGLQLHSTLLAPKPTSLTVPTCPITQGWPDWRGPVRQQAKELLSGQYSG